MVVTELRAAKPADPELCVCSLRGRAGTWASPPLSRPRSASLSFLSSQSVSPSPRTASRGPLSSAISPSDSASQSLSKPATRSLHLSQPAQSRTPPPGSAVSQPRPPRATRCPPGLRAPQLAPRTGLSPAVSQGSFPPLPNSSLPADLLLCRAPCRLVRARTLPSLGAAAD